MSDNSVIVLIGYMGCGKSSVGKKLSQKLNVKFVDLDNVIEKKYEFAQLTLMNKLIKRFYAYRF